MYRRIKTFLTGQRRWAVWENEDGNTIFAHVQESRDKEMHYSGLIDFCSLGHEDAEKIILRALEGESGGHLLTRAHDLKTTCVSWAVSYVAQSLSIGCVNMTPAETKTFANWVKKNYEVA